MYKIIIADDHHMTLLGTEAFLKDLNYYVAGSFSNGISCLNALVQTQPDIAIIDVSMPGISGLEVLAQVRAKKITTKIILITMHHEISVYYKAKELKCDGYVLKDNAQNDLGPCILQVMNGNKYISPGIEKNFIIDSQPNKNALLSFLTPTEIKILQLVANHKTNNEMAVYLFVSEKTIETHKQNIVNKLNLPKGKNVLLQWALNNVK